MRMQCSECGELISAYIDDELSKKEVKQLLFHLEQCWECKEELSRLLLQKEHLASLRASSFGPIPHLEFSQKVMAYIDKERFHPAPNRFGWSISEFCQWFFYSLKRPVFAMSLSALILLGFLGSIYLNVSTSKNDKNEQLMSVYELPTHKTASQTFQVADLESEEDSTVFHHVAYSSAETFANEPCLLQPAAYISVAGDN